MKNKLFLLFVIPILLCISANANGINNGVLSGVSKVPNELAEKFASEGRKVVVIPDGNIVIPGTFIREPYNVIGFCYKNGDIYISTYWNYSDDYFEYVTLHEFGHYLDFSTRLGDWDKEEGEKFADNFVKYILNPEELDERTYYEIETRLHEIKHDLEAK